MPTQEREQANVLSEGAKAAANAKNAPATKPGADPKEVAKANEIAKGPSIDDAASDAETEGITPANDGVIRAERREGKSSFVVLHVSITDQQGAAWRRGRVVWMPEDDAVTARLIALQAIRPTRGDEHEFTEVELKEDENPSYEDELATLRAELNAKNQRISLLEAEKANNSKAKV